MEAMDPDCAALTSTSYIWHSCKYAARLLKTTQTIQSRRAYYLDMAYRIMITRNVLAPSFFRPVDSVGGILLNMYYHVLKAQRFCGLINFVGLVTFYLFLLNFAINCFTTE